MHGPRVHQLKRLGWAPVQPSPYLAVVGAARTIFGPSRVPLGL